MSITIGDLSALGFARSRAVFRLRHRIFKDRLDWAVSSHNGEERDVFDDSNAIYVLDEDLIGEVNGCLRLIPSVRPYMLESVFSCLLDGRLAPRASNVWELSRFAYEADTVSTRGWGFSERALMLVRGAVAYALLRRIVRYVLVTSIAVERMMLRQGIHCYRLGIRFARIG